MGQYCLFFNSECKFITIPQYCKVHRKKNIQKIFLVVIFRNEDLIKLHSFGLGFFVHDKAKTGDIAVATASIFNEIRGEKDKPKMEVYLVVVPKLLAGCSFYS